MFYGYAEQVERLKTKLEEKDASKVHFLDMRKDGTFVDIHTKTTYKNWNEIKKKLAGVIIVDDIPRPNGKEM